MEQRWRSGGSDPLKVFVKQEPHSLSKIEEGRYRLISAVSLVDTMIDRILFGPMWRKALSRVLQTPCAVGWAPMHGGWRLLNQKYPRGTLSIDKKAWDWTVRNWLVGVWRDILLELHPGAPDWWIARFEQRFSYLFGRARFRFADGVEVVQAYGGIMKSGCYLTLCLNSIGQTVMHVLACNRMGIDPLLDVPLSFGDDIVMSPFEQQERYIAELNKLCIVKEAEVSTGVQFIGFLMVPHGFVPQYWEKHLFKLKHLDMSVAEDTLVAYQTMYAYDPVMLKFIRDYASVICPEAIVSDRFLREIVDV